MAREPNASWSAALPLSLLVLLQASVAGATSGQEGSLSLADLMRGLPQGNLAQRLDAASAGLLGADYALSALGEGEGPDSDPRLRLDAFDCTTYIETVAAMALAHSPAEVLPTLDSLRYAEGEAAFEARHHLPASQWLPAFQERGLLEEASASFGGESTRTVVWALDEETWRSRRRARDLDLPPARVPQGRFELAYVPIDRASELLSGVKAPLVLNVVRELTVGSPIVVTHQALLFPSPEGPRVRHASSVRGRVVETSLRVFVAGQAMARRWPVLGLNVQRWSDPEEGVERADE